MSGFEDSEFRGPAPGLSVGVSSLADLQSDGRLYDRVNIGRRDPAGAFWPAGPGTSAAAASFARDWLLRRLQASSSRDAAGRSSGGGRHVVDQKTLLAGGRAEALVERDERQRGGPALGRDKGRGQLQGVGGA